MMLWPAIILIILSIALAGIGLHITNGSGSADERAGGAIFFLFAMLCGGAGGLWWVVVMTIRELSSGA